MEISIVSPEYKGEEMVAELVSRISAAIKPISDDYEIILVNDCSPDNTWKEITSICQKNNKVKGINLSKNYGQSNAIAAGLSYAQGEWIVVIDCDLQDAPEDIPLLYEKAKEGYDIVNAWRAERTESFLKKLSSSIYHKTLNYFSGLNTDKEIAEFGIYHRKVIQQYLAIPEYEKTFDVLIHSLGFKTSKIAVSHRKRGQGESSYSLLKLLKISFNAIISYTTKPLYLAVSLGLSMSVISLIFAIYNIFAKYLGINEVIGYTSTIFSIWFVGGLLLFMLGILGLYIGKIFNQIKGRPSFIVMDTINIKK